MDERFSIGQKVVFITANHRTKLAVIKEFCDENGQATTREHAKRVRVEYTSKLGGKFFCAPTYDRVGLIDDDFEEAILERHLDELQSDARRT